MNRHTGIFCSEAEENIQYPLELWGWVLSAKSFCSAKLHKKDTVAIGAGWRVRSLVEGFALVTQIEFMIRLDTMLL